MIERYRPWVVAGLASLALGTGATAMSLDRDRILAAPSALEGVARPGDAGPGSVPKPGPSVLLGLGLGGLAFQGRPRR